MFNVGKSFALRLMLLLTLLALLAGCGFGETGSPTAEDPTGSPPGSPIGSPVNAPADSPAAAGSPADSSAASGEPVTMIWLIDEASTTRAMADALVTAYTAQHPNVTINVETRPGGTEGDNLVKTRLATGEMADIFTYNSGSLLQALNPAQTLVDLTNEPYIQNIDEAAIPPLSQNGKVFGVPTGATQAGGILYNRKVYEELGLSVPKTWAEFQANNEQIKAAGKTPVLQTYGNTWTSQLFVLADYCNVQNEIPTFAEDYTANKIKLASTAAAMRGFEYLQQGNEQGWYPQDYATTTFEQGLKMLADGEAAHYPMLTGTVPALVATAPDQVNDIGFFGMPGQDASKHCATIWIPGGTYIPQSSQNVDAAKQFLAFIASPEGVDAIISAVPPTGPYMIKGAELPEDVLQVVEDITAYTEAGTAVPALEFFSPVKGPNLEQICVAVGSGQMTPEEAAANYDTDVANQAKQLGLPGWE